MNGYVSYMDVLGFKSKIGASEFKAKYHELKNYISDQFHRDQKVEIYFVSDSIIVKSVEMRPAFNYARMLCSWGIRNDFWIRGAITQGDIEEINPADIVSANGNIILPFMGDAYLAAYKLESKLNMAGIVIDDTVTSNDSELPLLAGEDHDFIEYQEYLPKEGSEYKKRIIVPWPNEEIRVLLESLDCLHLRKMMGSHSADLDKYVNTFCFYVKLLMTRSDIQNVANFLDQLVEELNAYSSHFIIPPKIVFVFVSVVEGLLYRNDNPKKGDDKQTLKQYIPRIVEALKKYGHLPTFRDYLIEYDKKRDTVLVKYIHDVLFSEEQI